MLRRSVVAPGICGAALLVMVGIALVHLSNNRVPEAIVEAPSGFEEEAEEKLPPALARRLERLKSHAWCWRRESGGRASAEAEKFFALAFPVTTFRCPTCRPRAARPPG